MLMDVDERHGNYVITIHIQYRTVLVINILLIISMLLIALMFINYCVKRYY